MKKVKDLVKELLSQNQEANIEVIVNTVNADDERFDIDGYDISVFQGDECELDEETVPLFISKPKDKNDVSECISDFINNEEYCNDVINIQLNVKKGNIVITDEKGGVLRELELKNSTNREDNYYNIINRLREII